MVMRFAVSLINKNDTDDRQRDDRELAEEDRNGRISHRTVLLGHLQLEV